MPQIGKKYKHDYKGRVHIVGKFKDDGIAHVVYKTWRQTKQRWEYHVDSEWLLKKYLKY